MFDLNGVDKMAQMQAEMGAVINRLCVRGDELMEENARYRAALEIIQGLAFFPATFGANRRSILRIIGQAFVHPQVEKNIDSHQPPAI